MKNTTVLRAAKRGRYATKKKTTRRSSQPLVTVTRGLPVPQRMNNTMVYHEIVQLTIPAAQYVDYAFRANGLYDPNYSGTGHQPRYYDYLTSIYDQWYVTKATCRLDLMDSVTASQSGVMLVLRTDDDVSFASTTKYDAVEQPGAVYECIVPSMNQGKSLWKTWNVKTEFGSNISNNPDFKGTAAADPQEQQFFVVTAVGAPLDEVYVSVTITYEVEWTEMKTMGPS